MSKFYFYWLSLSIKWPPAIVYQHYDVPGLVQRCSEKCKNNLDEVKEFEQTTDLTNLPNSEGIRCYFTCFWIELGVMQPGSPHINPSDFFELMDQMTEQEQENYLTLMKGCTKRLNKIKDPVEVSYQAMACGKQNSNEVHHDRMSMNAYKIELNLIHFLL